MLLGMQLKCNFFSKMLEKAKTIVIKKRRASSLTYFKCYWPYDYVLLALRVCAAGPTRSVWRERASRLVGQEGAIVPTISLKKKWWGGWKRKKESDLYCVDFPRIFVELYQPRTYEPRSRVTMKRSKQGVI